MQLARENYRKEIDGKLIDLYTIKNKNGMVVKITNWGAKVQQILVPDKTGALGDVALGYSSIDQLQAGQSSMGAFIGRYANRIGQAKFTLNGQEYKLAANNGANSLHGGQKGSRFVVFDAKQIDDAEKRIAAQRDDVMAGIENMARDIGQDVYAKLAGQPADQGALAGKVTAAVKGGSR